MRIFGLTGIRRVVRRTTGVLALASVAAMGGCGDSTPFQVIEEVTFAASLGIDLAAMTKLPSGVYIQDEVVGTGLEVANGSQVQVTYTGWIADGTQFDTGSFGFQIGASQVIVGFELGLLGAQVGGTRLMIIPPDLGYGDRRSGIIPAGSVLVFRVTIDDVS